MPAQEDKDFFGRCVEDSMEQLYRVALRLTRNDADAEDLVAESVVKAWAAFPALKDRSRMRPWLLRILHNCFVSDYRKKAVRPDELRFDENCGDEDRHAIADVVTQQSNAFMHWWANPERDLVNSLLREDIVNAIERLPRGLQNHGRSRQCRGTDLRRSGGGHGGAHRHRPLADETRPHPAAEGAVGNRTELGTDRARAPGGRIK